MESYSAIPLEAFSVLKNNKSKYLTTEILLYAFYRDQLCFRLYHASRASKAFLIRNFKALKLGSSKRHKSEIIAKV